MSLNATPGGAIADSYCTVAEADAYWAARLNHDTWDGASTDDKERALKWATRQLDVMFEWVSWPNSTTQALQWPRQGCIDILYLSIIPSTSIPQRLKDATAEFASQLIDANRAADYAPEAKGLKSMSAGPVSMTFIDGVKPKVVPDAVRNMIPKWWGRIRGFEPTRSVIRA